MSVKFVTAKLFQKNGIPLYVSPKTEQIPCDSISVEGVEWWVPTLSSGRLTGYRRWIGNSPGGSALPQPDAVKTLRVRNHDTMETYWILIETTDDDTSFTANCNGCCGTTPVMATVTIPAPIVENCICADADGNYVHNFPIPANPNSLKYLVLTPSFNGVFGASLSGSGYTTPGNLLTAAAAAYAAEGTWSLAASNTILRLTSTTTSCAGLQVTLLTASYCLTLPVSSTPVNGIKFGTTVYSFGTFSVSQTLNQQALINAISQYLIGTIVLASSDTKIQYTGLQVPVAITFDGSNVSGMTFAAGVCS